MLSLAFLEMLQWDIYTNISKGNNIDGVKVMWKTVWCNYSLKFFKAAVSIESQAMLAAARQSRRRASFERYCINGIHLTENDIRQSCQHLLKDLELRLLVFFCYNYYYTCLKGAEIIKYVFNAAPTPPHFQAKVRGRPDS